MTRSYSIRLGAAYTSNSNFIKEITDYQNIDININPTSFGDWSTTIPYDPSIEDYILERVYIVDDVEGDVIFAGILETVNSDGTGSAVTNISGRGIFIEEDYESRSYQVSSGFLRDEIKNFGNNYIKFDTTFIDAAETSDKPFQDDGSTLNDDVENTLSTDPVTQGTESLYVADVGTVTDFTQSEYDAAVKSGDTASIDGEYSQGKAVELGGSSGTHTIEFDIGSFEYDLTSWELPVRYEASGVDEVRFYINGTLEATDTSPPGSQTWVTYTSTTTFSVGTTLTLRVEIDTTDTSTAVFDVLSVHDDRYAYNTPTTLNINNVYSGPEQTPQTFDFQFEPKGSQTSTDASASFEVDAHPNADEPLTDFEADITGNLQAGGTETINETYTSDSDTKYVPFDVTFSGDATSVEVDFRSKLQPDYKDRVSGETGRTSLAALFYATIVPFDDENLTYIEEKEYSGTDAEIYKQLHKDSVYSFAIDYGASGETTINTFPDSTKTAFDGVRVNEYNREIDYSEYANQITVRSRDDSGNIIEATTKDSDEIDRIGQVVHRKFSEPSLSTQTEVQFAAANRLKDHVLEAEQSGTINAVPTRIKPGFSYAWTPFNDYFTNGGVIGDAGLLLDGTSSQWLEADTYVNIETPTRTTFDFLIWPRLRELGDNEYYTMFGTTHGKDGDFVRVYGDGSLEVCQPTESGAAGFTRTEAGLLLDRDVTRVTIDMSTTSGKGGIYVGEGVAGSPDEPLPYTDEPDLGHITISKSTPVSSDSISSTSDVWYRFDAYDAQTSANLSYDSDIDSNSTLVDVRGNHNLDVSDPSSTVEYEPQAISGAGVFVGSSGKFEAKSGNGTTFTIGTSDFSMSAWVEDISSSTLTERYIFDKNRSDSDGAVGPGEGHALYIEPDTGYLVYEVNNGTSTQTLKSGTSLYNGTYHVGVTLEQGGRVKLWVDGEIVDSATYAFSGESVGTATTMYVASESGGNWSLKGTISDLAWFNSLVSDSEMKTLSQYEPFTNSYNGGIDDLRVWNEIDDITVLLENPFEDYRSSTFDGTRTDYAQTYWIFDSFNASDEAKNNYGIDIWDEAGHGSPTSLYHYGGTLHEPERGTLQEVSISIGRGKSSMSLNLQLSRRVDANLSQAIEDIDEVKKLL